MKEKILTYFLLFLSTFLVAQDKQPYKTGELLRYKMSYSGFLKAGTAVFHLKEADLNGKKVHHAIGRGWTSSVVSWFFKVEDNYQTYFDKKDNRPYLFKRKIDEGGYKKNRQTSFNYVNNTAYILDFQEQKDSIIPITSVQDLISTFYFLRKQNTNTLKVGDNIKVNIFFDYKSFPFQLKFLRRETLSTKFGKVKTLVFNPLVQAGRVFKAKESVTIWITDDANKIPIKMQADLSVGSLRSELEAYKGLANSFDSIVD